MSSPTTEKSAPKTSKNAAPDKESASDLALTLDVEPRKPRLAWQGMDRKEAVTSVPTQIVEIVRPGKAASTEGQIPGITAAQQSARPPSNELPPNRLIWTNDNLVALRTLLDERDPVAKEYRYRGKVDLVYIDPPFMVQGDFVADNAIDIELDEDEHVEAKKEPSLVEILAYKDTWRQGLDSFLSMLRERLVLLKDLLSPTGSIYVHLDWHAVHYVKVLMDELFGYENFRAQVVWKRSASHNDTKQGRAGYGRIHDTILFYTQSNDWFWGSVFTPHDPDYVRAFYKYFDERGRRYQLDNLTAAKAGGDTSYEFMGVRPASGRYWAYSREKMDQMARDGRIVQTRPGAIPRYKRYLDEMPGVSLQDIWDDFSAVASQSTERLGYPTQKPVALAERIIRTSCPPGGLVLDCFVGSGTTLEAAERVGRRWVGIDNGKYAVHLSRKRLIQLHGVAKPSVNAQSEYIECATCKTIERKEKAQKARGTFDVRPFTLENMGVYQRAEQWQDFQTNRSMYRDEMVKVFGGDVVHHSPLLHGRKGRSWVHIGPLDGAVSSPQAWSIAREAQKTDIKIVEILSADFDTLAGSTVKDDIKLATGITVIVRVIPASAIDEVRRRLELQRSNPNTPIESMAIPAFYAPLAITLKEHVSGRMAKLTLDRCEIDIESFIASQRPVLKPVTATTTPAAKKKLKAETDKWTTRQRELEKWLAKATSWQKFIDFWAVDWDYGRRIGLDEKPIFETDWQSFRVRKTKGEIEPLVLTAEYKYSEPGHYRVAARVTDVFGNDGIATVNMEVK